MDREALATGPLDQLCSLSDPTRRQLYDYVAAQDVPVSRDHVSSALNIDRSTVVYHLDRLVEEGLLVASFARPAGRGGPGAGRPAKHYERAGREFTVSVPPRDYHLAAKLLARAAERDPSGAVREALAEAAAELGSHGVAGDEQPPEDLFSHLVRLGFEPYHDGELVRLRNCPFDRLAQEHTEVICGMNLALLTGAVEAYEGGFEARLDPAEGRCCVALVPTAV